MWIITKAKYAKMETFDFKINKIFFIFGGSDVRLVTKLLAPVL